MYSHSTEHARHCCWSSGDATRLYPDGQLASTYLPVPASKVQLPTSTDPSAQTNGMLVTFRRAHTLSALHTAPAGNTSHAAVLIASVTAPLLDPGDALLPLLAW